MMTLIATEDFQNSGIGELLFSRKPKIDKRKAEYDIEQVLLV